MIEISYTTIIAGAKVAEFTNTVRVYLNFDELTTQYIDIAKDGTFGQPTSSIAERISSIADAEKFIKDFQPMHDELLVLAEKVKAELPKEWFEVKL
jgi:hypothetical protein